MSETTTNIGSELRNAASTYEQTRSLHEFAMSKLREAIVQKSADVERLKDDVRQRLAATKAAEKVFVRAAFDRLGVDCYEPFLIRGWIYRLDSNGGGNSRLAQRLCPAMVKRIPSGVTIPGEVTLCGIGYRVAVAEELVVFSEAEPIWGQRSRFSFRRKAQCWYVSIEGDCSEVSVAHIEAAAEIVREVFGASFEGKHGEHNL